MAQQERDPDEQNKHAISADSFLVKAQLVRLVTVPVMVYLQKRVFHQYFATPAYYGRPLIQVDRVDHPISPSEVISKAFSIASVTVMGPRPAL